MDKMKYTATKVGEAYVAAKGKKPKDAPKLPRGWHYMPDGKVMKDSEHEKEEMEYDEEEEDYS